MWVFSEVQNSIVIVTYINICLDMVQIKFYVISVIYHSSPTIYSTEHKINNTYWQYFVTFSSFLNANYKEALTLLHFSDIDANAIINFQNVQRKWVSNG